VEILWTDGAKAVDVTSMKDFSMPEFERVGAPTAAGCRLRADLRLFRGVSVVESSLRRHPPRHDSSPIAHPVDIHRYEEEIAGRTYHIEVHAVSDEQWRAKLARRPGMPTALMPFYGPTPDLAARELANWLTLQAAGRTR